MTENTPNDALVEAMALAISEARTGNSLSYRHFIMEAQAAAAVIEADREAVRAPLLAEIERLREALGWYEKQANDCRKITREGDDARYALDRDGGERARAALAGDSHD